MNPNKPQLPLPMILIKASGAEIEKPEFAQTAHVIEKLLAEGNSVTLVAGAGNQITKQYQESTGLTRPKGGITTPEVFTHGVMPAQKQVIESLEQYLPPFQLLRATDIPCKYMDLKKLGSVGTPTSVNISPEYGQLEVVSNVGVVDDQRVNVNADWITNQIVVEYAEQIKELIFLTPAGGILDKEQQRVPFLTPLNLEKILSGQHPTIQVSEGMMIKAKAILEMLKKIPKIVLTTNEDIGAEIDTTLGAGTLCMNIEGGDFTSAIETPYLTESFNEIYETQIQNGTWLDRGEEGKSKVLQSHLLYEVDDTLLGGFSHERLNDTLIMIQCVWSQSKWGGNGISQTMLEKYIEQQPAKALALFCNSKNQAALKSFEKIGFVEVPPSHPQYRTIIDVPHGEKSIPMILMH